MIYGANGYTGELITKEAVSRGLKPIIAGRSSSIRILAEDLDLSYKIFNLKDQKSIVEILEDIDILLNCAGPFSSTAKPMIIACIASKTHYLDITGEISVFEYAKSIDNEAKKSGVLLMPGVGFDVVPTDSLAVILNKKLPNANFLKFGLYSSGISSQGTAKTSVEALKTGFYVRENGILKKVKYAHKTRMIEFGLDNKISRMTMCIPWGDVSTAYHSTKIPNIEVYQAAHPKLIKKLRRLRKLSYFFKVNFILDFMKKQVNSTPRGPDENILDKGKTYIWAEISDRSNTFEAQMITPNGYKLTVDSSLLIINKIIETPLSGYHTPGSVFGENILDELEGIKFKIEKV